MTPASSSPAVCFWSGSVWSAWSVPSRRSILPQKLPWALPPGCVQLVPKINELSFSLLDRVGTSTLLTRITNDVNQVQNGVNLVLRLFMRSPFIVFGACVMAFTIDPGSALLFLIVVALLSVVVFGIMLLTIKRYKGYSKPAGFRFEHHA